MLSGYEATVLRLFGLTEGDKCFQQLGDASDRSAVETGRDLDGLVLASERFAGPQLFQHVEAVESAPNCGWAVQSVNIEWPNGADLGLAGQSMCLVSTRADLS